MKDLTSVPQLIEVKFYSEDLGQLLSLAPTVADAISKIPGIVEVKDGIVLAGKRSLLKWIELKQGSKELIPT
jgi:hypothetical protein